MPHPDLLLHCSLFRGQTAQQGRHPGGSDLGERDRREREAEGNQPLTAGGFGFSSDEEGFVLLECTSASALALALALALTLGKAVGSAAASVQFGIRDRELNTVSDWARFQRSVSPLRASWPR